MMLSLDTGLSGLEQFQEQINVVANNIANVNTVGFKQSDVSFADTLSETIGSNAESSLQIGTGVMTSSITQDFSTPGSLTSTGVQSNLAISGNGFFVVTNPANGNTYVTQDGDFNVDQNGYLVNSSGMQVQGTNGAIQITSPSSATVTGYTIGTDGTVTVDLSDGTTSTVGQIVMQNFSNPDELVSVGGNLFTAPASAGGLAAPATSGTNGLGTIDSGYLEMSNVDLAGQLTDLISAQNAYQANSKVVTTSDAVLQTLVNMVQT